MKINEFYLISTELRTPYEPRKCKIVKTLRSKIRSDMVLTEVEPPLSSDIYNTSAPINMLILASRHEGKSLLSISEWPIYVYICRLKDEKATIKDKINADDLVIMDWGAAYNSLEEALKYLKK